MDQIVAMRAFRQVAELGSFTAAAEKLNISNGAVSKHVSALERHLGAQLMVRTTRQVKLTDDGRGYLERCVRILDDVDESARALTRERTVPGGLLRVSAPVSFSIVRLGAVFAEFLQRYPQIQLDLNLSDRFVDPVEEGLDVVLRVVRQLPDSTLVARKLADVDFVICAAPDYLKQAGTPKVPEDLRKHQCLLYAQPAPKMELRLNGPHGERRVTVQGGRYQCSNSLPLREALVAGLGIALIPMLYVEDLLKAGKLVALLKQYRFASSSLYAIYPHNRHLSAKVKALVDFLLAHFSVRALAEPLHDGARRKSG